MRNRHKYPPEWTEVIRPAVLRRDKYRCTDCGAQNHKEGYYTPSGGFVQCDEHMKAWALSQGIKVVRVHLQICHLDQNPENNELTNLAAKCPKHHLKYDHAFRHASRIGKHAQP